MPNVCGVEVSHLATRLHSRDLNSDVAKKFVCTAIRPTLLPYPELSSHHGISQFVSDYVASLPLTSPTSAVRCLRFLCQPHSLSCTIVLSCRLCLTLLHHASASLTCCMDPCMNPVLFLGSAHHHVFSP